MFGIKKKDNTKSQQPDNASKLADTQPQAPVDIYTLPERFLPHASVKPKAKRNILLYVLVAVFVIVLGVGAFIWYSSMQTDQNNGNGTVTIAPITEPDQDEDKEDPITQESPQPITYIARSVEGNITGIITLSLSAADRALAEQITISASDAPENTVNVFSSYYRIAPTGRRLQEKAELKLEYFDTNLTSVVENSLRVARLEGGTWKPDEQTFVDLNKNELVLFIDQLPVGQVAVVSNLEEAEINPVEEDPIVFDQQELVSSQDSDGDGLSNIEEQLYKTDPGLPDTDRDGYIDGAEVVGLYSPNSGSGATLLTAGLASLYANDTYGYQVLYPSSWNASPIDQLDASVIFATNGSQFIEVLIEERDLLFGSVVEWYQEQVPGLVAENIVTTTVGKDEIDAILSLDGSTIYFFHEDRVVGIHYNIGIDSQAHYLTTWQMMQNSWQSVPVDLSDEPVDEGDSNQSNPEESASQ